MHPPPNSFRYLISCPFLFTLCCLSERRVVNLAVPAAVPRPPGLGKKARKPIGADCRNGQRIVASPFFTTCTIVFSVLFPLLSFPWPLQSGSETFSLSGTISAVWTCSAEVGRRPVSRLLDRGKKHKDNGGVRQTHTQGAPKTHV